MWNTPRVVTSHITTPKTCSAVIIVFGSSLKMVSLPGDKVIQWDLYRYGYDVPGLEESISNFIHIFKVTDPQENSPIVQVNTLSSIHYLHLFPFLSRHGRELWVSLALLPCPLLLPFLSSISSVFPLYHATLHCILWHCRSCNQDYYTFFLSRGKTMGN